MTQARQPETTGLMLEGEYEAMSRSEERHWWYKGLRHQVRLALGGLDAPPEGLAILDAGCGTGGMLRALDGHRVFGFDLSARALGLASPHLPSCLVQASALAIPFKTDTFDAVVSLDVLSNIPHDAQALMLEEVLRVLKPGGLLILNTAACQWLYGEHDRAVGVVKRFGAGEVRALLTRTGFSVLRAGYSNALLFLPAACFRLAKRALPQSKAQPSSDLFALPGPVNTGLAWVRFLENRLLQSARVRMPVGLSVFATACKPQSAAGACAPGPAALGGLDVSVVVPVYNAKDSIGPLCEALRRALPCSKLEIVLVNDGSRDASHQACLAACASHPQTVRYLRLSRNFGEHNAVMAGLGEAGGQYTVIIDDDFQNPPAEAARLVERCAQGGYDVVYGRFRSKRHAPWRNLGSSLNGLAARWLLGKPPGVYLSSFKCISRFAREQATAYCGPNPYLDALILRVTDRIGQVEVEHDARARGRSGYTLAKLVGLWLTVFLGFSPAPARLAMALGLAAMLCGLAALGGAAAAGSGPWAAGGLAAALGGAALAASGLAGEYAARALQERNGWPQFVVRERHGAQAAPKERP